jgi:hypothetical protein
MFTSGCPFPDQPSSLYKAWAIPLVLRTEPLPPAKIVNDDDPAIHYHGDWLHSTGRKYGDIRGDVHATQTVGAAAELTFDGTGIELLSEKVADHGVMEVRLDDRPPETVTLTLQNFPRLSQVVVFSAYGLAPGRHKIEVVHRGPDFGIIDAFRVYGP